MADTEAHYAQIEKEMLSIVFAVERFEQCVYGRPVKVETDHKPLESIFNSYQSAQAKEPMISHHIPTRPWEKVGMDLFELNNRDFLITVDYYSNYFEVDRLTSKTAKEVINKKKANFARHGIPD